MHCTQEAGLSTRAIHFGYDPHEHHNSVTVPIYATTTFGFEHAQDCADAFSGAKPAYIYTRISNPTNDVLEKRIASLEGAEGAVVFASGMGAISGTLLTFLNTGDTIIASDKVYGCTFALFEHTFKRFGINVVWVDSTNNEAVKKAFSENKNIKILYTEAIINPSNFVVDLCALAEIAHSVPGCRFVVDSTFCSPVVCTPLSYGADIVVHSATKYLIAGAGSTAGVVCGKMSDMNSIRGIGLKDITGAVMAPVIASQMIFSLETLDLRVSRISESAAKVAKFLEGHKGIEKVVHTSLESHPNYANCKKYLKKCNGIISFYVKGDIKTTQAVIDNFHLITDAVSLGKCETLATQPAMSTHSTYTKEEQEKVGIAQNLIRMSIGTEDIEDILADIKQSLDKVFPN